MKPLKLAVVGAGHLGPIHARLLAEMPDVELVGVADPLSTASEPVAADCRTRAFADHRQLLELVDAAIIAVPTRHHRDVALDFLRRGTPLLVEKPLADNLADADELVEAAKRSATILQVGHVERFNPAFAAAAEHIQLPRYVEAVRASGFTGRSTDIGVVHDLMIHDIDLLLSLVRSPLASVSALGLSLLGRHEDMAQARLEFANGCVANLSASRFSYSPAPRRQMHVWHEHGFVAIDFEAHSATVVRPCQTVVERQFDFDALAAEEKATFKERLFSEILPVENLALESRNALVDELRDFIDSVRSDRAPRVGGEQGRDALAVAEQILHAIHERSIGPHGTPAPDILRGPHWHSSDSPHPARREAG